MNLSEFHTDSSFRFRWSTPDCQLELAYIVERERWGRRARVSGPDGPAGWNDPQNVDLPRVDTEDEARSVAEQYASERTP